MLKLGIIFLKTYNELFAEVEKMQDNNGQIDLAAYLIFKLGKCIFEISSKLFLLKQG